MRYFLLPNYPITKLTTSFSDFRHPYSIARQTEAKPRLLRELGERRCAARTRGPPAHSLGKGEMPASPLRVKGRNLLVGRTRHRDGFGFAISRSRTSLDPESQGPPGRRCLHLRHRIEPRRPRVGLCAAPAAAPIFAPFRARIRPSSASSTSGIATTTLKRIDEKVVRGNYHCWGWKSGPLLLVGIFFNPTTKSSEEIPRPCYRWTNPHTPHLGIDGVMTLRSPTGRVPRKTRADASSKFSAKRTTSESTLRS